LSNKENNQNLLSFFKKMEIKMKYRLFFITLAGMLLIAACSPTTSIIEEPAAKAVVETPGIDVDEITHEEEPELDSPSIDSDMLEVSFSQDVWPILEKYALTAHGGKGGVFLENYEDILNYVEPGNPEGSLLYRALIGDGMPQMPPGNPLPDELIQTVHSWIEQGAKEN
jgi:hypothetical protein